MWPNMRFDPKRLFDLRIPDVLFHDPYYARMWPDVWQRLEDVFIIGLIDAPDVVGYLGELQPEQEGSLRKALQRLGQPLPNEKRKAEMAIIDAFFPWNLGMAKCPEAWDALPWSCWDPAVIYEHVDLENATVLDAGAGTGQVALRCAPYAKAVLALEPVARLRRYIERKAGAAGLNNIRTLAGVLDSTPLPDSSLDASILSNGSFGWYPDAELAELERVTRPGGTILMLGPRNYGSERTMELIRAAGYQELRFTVPGDGDKPAFLKANLQKASRTQLEANTP